MSSLNSIKTDTGTYIKIVAYLFEAKTYFLR